jgi:tRNA nucleotidyltransferase (CCA-adding enzyme)
VESASEIKSAVDRTPFHNKYILKNLKKKMSGDVRLLKKFTKSVGVYGSDMKTLGFSGYLCELLIIKYGSFKNLITKAREWTPGTLIDLEKHCEIKNIKETFEGQPLIVIDPTDPKRNVAAALSPENFIIFINACEKFLETRNAEMFFGEKKSFVKVEIEEIIRKRGTNFFIVNFEKPKVVDDILWPQLRRTVRRIANFLEENEFKVLNYTAFTDHRAYMMFEMEVWELPTVKKLIGPPIFSDKHSHQFLSKYKDSRIFIEDIKWVAEIGRIYKDAEKILFEFLSQPQPKMKENGIGSHIAASLSTGFEILTGKEIMHLIEFNQDFRIFISEYLGKNLVQ